MRLRQVRTVKEAWIKAGSLQETSDVALLQFQQDQGQCAFLRIRFIHC